MFYLLRVDALPNITYVSGIPDDSIYIMTFYFLCRLISDDMIAMEIVCLRKNVEILLI
jgi:hypothetical protein